MTTSDRPRDYIDLIDSPAALIASLFAARRTGDDVLARWLARRLASMGIMIEFAPAATAKGGAR